MGHRKDDVRIYVISGVFLICSTSGGIFLSLYIFFPNSKGGAISWLSIAGLILVAIPWVVWLLIYLYRCFRAMVSADQFPERINHGKPPQTPKSVGVPTDVVVSSSLGGQESTVAGARHVHFGAVVVVENDSSASGGSHVECHEEISNDLAHTMPEEARESEMPLTPAIRL